jgi:predicted transcriptional regulator
MRREAITFRLDADKKKALDAIAAGLDRDRSYVLNEAICSYLDIYHSQVEHIKEGVRQAEAGRFAEEAAVAKVFGRGRKGKH